MFTQKADAPTPPVRGRGRARGRGDQRGRGRGIAQPSRGRGAPQIPRGRGAPPPTRGRGTKQAFQNKTWTRPQLLDNTIQQDPIPSIPISFPTMSFVDQDAQKDTSTFFPANNNHNNNGGFMSNDDRAARFSTSAGKERYDQLKANRKRERKLAIEQGLLPDEMKQVRLADAIVFRGTCQSMCPEFEAVEREYQNELDDFEKDPMGNLDLSRVVKKYRRSAAGNDAALPSDVRTPEALTRALNYLVDEILSKHPLPKCHAFLNDRTRSIRQDFTLQNIRDATAVDLHERIARFHILSLHEMSTNDEMYSEHLELDQLRKVLTSLMEFYDDLRQDNIETNNQAEFYAYNIISQIRSQDVIRKTQSLPPHIFLHPYVQRAVEFYGFVQRNNEIEETSTQRKKPSNVYACQNFYSRFFKLVRDPGTPFLMACLLESNFPDVRKGALKAMNVAFRREYGNLDATYVMHVLGYDSVEQLKRDVEAYGLPMTFDLAKVMVGWRFQDQTSSRKGVYRLFLEPLSFPYQERNHSLIEPKRAGLSIRDIIDGAGPPPVPLPRPKPRPTTVQPLRPPPTFEKMNTMLATASPFAPPMQKTPVRAPLLPQIQPRLQPPSQSIIPPSPPVQAVAKPVVFSPPIPTAPSSVAFMTPPMESAEDLLARERARRQKEEEENARELEEQVRQRQEAERMALLEQIKVRRMMQEAEREAREERQRAMERRQIEELHVKRWRFNQTVASGNPWANRPLAAVPVRPPPITAATKHPSESLDDRPSASCRVPAMVYSARQLFEKEAKECDTRHHHQATLDDLVQDANKLINGYNRAVARLDNQGQSSLPLISAPVVGVRLATEGDEFLMSKQWLESLFLTHLPCDWTNFRSVVKIALWQKLCAAT